MVRGDEELVAAARGEGVAVGGTDAGVDGDGYSRARARSDHVRGRGGPGWRK